MGIGTALSTRSASLIRTLVHYEGFRRYVKNCTGSSDEYRYRFITRLSEENPAKDSHLWDGFDKKHQIDGSNFEDLQEVCSEYEMSLLGLCYARTRQSTGFTQEMLLLCAEITVSSLCHEASNPQAARLRYIRTCDSQLEGR